MHKVPRTARSPSLTTTVAEAATKPTIRPTLVPLDRMGVGVHAAPRERRLGNLYGLLANPSDVDGLKLPKLLAARLRADRKRWLKNGTAPGPAFINNDLARRQIRTRKKDDP